MKGRRLLIVLGVVIVAAVAAVAAYASFATVGPGPIPAPDGARVYYLPVLDAWYMIEGASATLHVYAFHPECGGRVIIDQTRVGNTADVQIHTTIPEDKTCAASGEYKWIEVDLTGTYDPAQAYTITVNGYEAYRVEPTPTPTPTLTPTPGPRKTPTPGGAHF
jgi:hypothetical protein